MKKIFTLILLLIGANQFVSAQCVPDTSITHNDPGIYPDTLTGLPHALVGVGYNADIQVKVLTDTVYLGFPATVDSINIVNVSGLPNGFTYTCFPANCSFPGGSDACILLSCASPNAADEGVYPLTVNTVIYGQAFGFPQTVPQDITGYYIVLETNLGIATLNPAVFAMSQNSPNPSSSLTSISVSMPQSSTVQFKMVNLIGKEVMAQQYAFNKGLNTIPVNLNGIPNGIYLYTVSYGGHSLTRRMIVSEK